MRSVAGIYARYQNSTLKHLGTSISRTDKVSQPLLSMLFVISAALSKVSTKQSFYISFGNKILLVRENEKDRWRGDGLKWYKGKERKSCVRKRKRESKKKEFWREHDGLAMIVVLCYRIQPVCIVRQGKPNRFCKKNNWIGNTHCHSAINSAILFNYNILFHTLAFLDNTCFPESLYSVYTCMRVSVNGTSPDKR